MQIAYDNLSPEFQEFYYYLISDNKMAEFARLRNDIPHTVVIVLHERELEIAKELLLAKLDDVDRSNAVYYIQFLVVLGEVRAIPKIKKMLSDIKKYRRVNRRHWSYEKKKCRKALRYLKKVR